jgi:16S rRNA (guanine527-N7)-methyltransferase
VTDAKRLYGPRYPTICQYVDILSGQGVEWGLLGPREVDRLWERHILNSAALADLIPEGCRVADVGSGAGLPGIPVAVLRPDLEMTLLEPLLRRSRFLTHTVENLGITDTVRVVRSRAEDHHDAYDAVLSRALAPLDRLIAWCNPLRSPAGVILALKGRSAQEEVDRAGSALREQRLRADVLVVRATPDAGPTTVVRLTGR